MNINILEERLALIDAEIAALSRRLEKLPEGKLYIVNNGGYSKWFVTDGHKSIYLPKRERALASDLAYKKYVLARLDCLESERCNLLYKVNASREASNKLEKILLDVNYQDLLKDQTKISENEWMNEEYAKNSKHPEHLTQRSTWGEVFRSKSELNIARALRDYDIPYRYEWELEVDGNVFYPDFTIIRPSTKKLIRWEHFGIMDSDDYVSEFTYKMPRYCRAGYIPGDNLIMTFETKEKQIDPFTIDETIRFFIL